MPAAKIVLTLAAAAALAGCDLLGESTESILARKEAEGRAVGSACRHANRAIEDCYGLNRKAPKSAVFAGWREMDEYMRENKLEGIEPTLAKAPSKSAGASEAEGEGEDTEGDTHGSPAAHGTKDGGHGG
jgi:hypothetical protein